MDWFFIGLLAQLVLGTSAVFDKLILKKSYPNPVGYTFWLGVLGLAFVVALPFGFRVVSLPVLALGLVAGFVFMLGMLFYFWALYYGEGSGSIVAISGFSPVATLIFSMVLLGTSLEGYQMMSFGLLVAGGFLLACLEQKGSRLWALFFVLIAAGFFGLSNILSKIVFDQTSFITGFFWTKVGGALTALLFLLYPRWREAILHPQGASEFRHKWAYVLNRGYAGVGSFLIFYAISLGTPPLVDALQSVRFFIVFIGGWLILREHLRFRILVGEFVAFTCISLAVLVIGAGDYLRMTAPDPNRPVTWGVTFSQKFAEDFGIPWEETYRAMLDDLGVKHLRLIAYWDVIEPERDRFDFSGLDYQMRLAREHGALVILAVGQKLPRWPECHDPGWVSGFSELERKKEFEAFLASVVERYRDDPTLRYWQVENEPFLPFGECSTISRNALDAEVALVRSQDPAHKILTTDSGELGLWYAAAHRGDVFGTTMYRRVHNNIFGYIDYHLPPEFFRLKEQLVRFMLGDQQKPFLVAELAAEPWMTKQLWETDPKVQLTFFDEPFFEDTIEYAKRTGFDEYYLWGVEWWYWLKVKHDNPVFWVRARQLFRPL